MSQNSLLICQEIHKLCAPANMSVISKVVRYGSHNRPVMIIATP